MDDLRAIYGDQFLKFALARTNIEGPLTRGQKASVTALRGLITSNPPDEVPTIRHWNLRLRIGLYLEEYETTIGWILHRQSGGKLHDISHDDGLTENLLKAARDAWPTLLLPSQEILHMGSVSSHSNPAAQKAMRQILEDDALKKIFSDVEPRPEDGDSTTIGTQISFSTGHGHGLQPATMPDVFIMSARARQLLKGDPDSLMDYLEFIPEVLTEARELARGKEVLVPRLVGLTNIDIDAELKISTPAGSLRSPSKIDRQLLAASDDGVQITAVLEISIPIKMFVRDRAGRDMGDAYYEKLIPILNEHGRRIELPLVMFELILLLCSSDDTFIAPTPVSFTTFGPLEYGLVQGRIRVVGHPFGSSTLDAATAERVDDWAEKIARNPPSTLALGVRRLVAAATSRVDPIDGFIDAVVCWENMFGAAPETGFRVCGAMACIIESTDTARRIALFDDLKKLYNTRSGVVHGSVDLDMNSAYDHRTRAIRLAIKAIRQLYEYPDLLNLKQSHQRGQHILLAVNLDPSMQTEG